MSMKYFIAAFFIYLLIINLSSYLLYGIDKSKAVRGRRRIPEKTLIGSSLLGGAFLGYLSMFVFRHKTRHWYFHFFNISSIIIYSALIALFIFFIKNT